MYKQSPPDLSIRISKMARRGINSIPALIFTALVVYILYILLFGSRAPKPPPGAGMIFDPQRGVSNSSAVAEVSGYVPVLDVDKMPGMANQPIAGNNIGPAGLPENAELSGDVRLGLTDSEREHMKYLLPKLQRVVHLDLKGAAPKISYLQKVIPLIAKLGATGLLLEWEDMFPYTGRLEGISAENCYSPEQVAQILKIAADSHLVVIPLVQTFGHLEFLLKLKQFKHLREEMGNPQVINPHLEESVELIIEMINQQLNLHPNVEQIHIGADEVWALGLSPESQKLMGEFGMAKSSIFVQHLKKIAGHIRTEHPRLEIFMWDDMFREMDEFTIRKSGVNRLVTPVIWKYSKSLDGVFPDDMIPKYGKLFSNIWIATAFKGATGSSKYLTDISHHYQNHIAWMKILASTDASAMNVQGTMITGWSRYDHFSVLVELLPVSVPCLAVMLSTLQYAGVTKVKMDEVNNKLGCASEAPIQWKIDNKDTAIIPNCTYPGHKVLEGAYMLKNALFIYSYITSQANVHGWRKDFSLRRNYIAYWASKYITNKANQTLVSLDAAENYIRPALKEIYSEDVTEEWVETYITSVRQEVTSVQNTVKNAWHDSWPRRPMHRHMNNNGEKIILAH